MEIDRNKNGKEIMEGDRNGREKESLEADRNENEKYWVWLWECPSI